MHRRKCLGLQPTSHAGAYSQMWVNNWHEFLQGGAIWYWCWGGMGIGLISNLWLLGFSLRTGIPAMGL